MGLELLLLLLLWCLEGPAGLLLLTKVYVVVGRVVLSVLANGLVMLGGSSSHQSCTGGA